MLWDLNLESGCKIEMFLFVCFFTLFYFSFLFPDEENLKRTVTWHNHLLISVGRWQSALLIQHTIAISESRGPFKIAHI